MYGKLKVTKALIYNHLNDYDLFKTYNSNFKKLGGLFISDIREDKNPTCCINKYGNNLLYVDFADINLKGVDVFTYISKKFNINYYQVLDLINKDFNLPYSFNYYDSINSNVKPVLYNLDIKSLPDKKYSKIEVKIRNFNKNDKLFWNEKTNITVKDLKFFKVFPLKYFTQDGLLFSFTYSYGYYFGIDNNTKLQRWKCYNPFGNKYNKWKTNCGNNIIQGYLQLPKTGKILIITKSLKDVIVLYKLGIPAIAPQAENHLLSKKVIADLKTRFDNIFVLFDNDEAGLKGSEKYKNEYNLPFFYIPLELEVKDPFECVKEYDYKLLNDIIYASTSYNSPMAK